MTAMRGARNIGGCGCQDCGNDETPSRSSEKREWQQDVRDEQSAVQSPA
jgi:hypothetical protein